MKKMSSQLTTLLSLCLLPFAVLAEDSLQALNKMSQAMSDLNYEVAFVQTSPTNMDSFRYRHIKQEQKVYAQLVTLDGEQQEIIQRDNLVSYFQPGSQAFTINSGYIVDALPALFVLILINSISIMILLSLEKTELQADLSIQFVLCLKMIFAINILFF